MSGLSLDTETDLLSLGLITPKSEAVIARVDSASSNDYLEMEIVRRQFTLDTSLKSAVYPFWATKNRLKNITPYSQS